MCQSATKSLGSGGSEPPKGEQGVKSPSGGCPNQKKQGSILVEVYEGSSSTLLKNVTVSLTGPSSGKPLEYASATKYYSALDPSDDFYEITVSYDNLEKYKEGRLEPNKHKIKLKAGEAQRVYFRLFPPVSGLVVQVVNKDTGQVITDHKFTVIVPKLKAKELTDLPGSKKFATDPGVYDQIEVDLSEQALQQRYVLAERGKGEVQPGKEQVAQVKLAVRSLTLLSVDLYFAPKVEKLDIKYQIRHMQDQDVYLQIRDASNNLVYENLFSSEEKKDSSIAVIHWDGKANQTAGDFKAGDYVTCAKGPYKISLVHPIIQYHSEEKMHQQQTELVCDITLEQMSWLDVYREVAELPNDPGTEPPANEAKRNMWLKLKLNQIGFYAGPINGRDNDPEFQKALRRYRLMRAINGAEARKFDALGAVAEGALNDFPAELTTLTTESGKLGSVDALISKLKLEETSNPNHMPLRAFDAPADLLKPDKEVKLYLDGTRYYIDNPEWVTEYSWGNRLPEKCKAEDAWFSNPLVPFRATVKIKRKTNEWVDVPDEIKMAVRWYWWDLKQETSTLPCLDNAGTCPGYTNADHSRTKQYIEKALAAQSTHTGSRCYPNNAGVDFGGLVSGDDSQNACAVWRVLQEAQGGNGQQEIPADDRGAATDKQRGWARTWTRKGASSVYFRPSRIAGERYQLGVSLDLNPPDDTGSRCKKTAKLTLWRRLRLAAFIPWANANNLRDFLEQPIDLDAVWRQVQAEYAHAFIEVDALTNQNKLRIDHAGLKFKERFDEAASKIRADLEVCLKAMEDKLGAKLTFNPDSISSLRLLIFLDPAPRISEVLNRLLGGFLSGIYSDYLEQTIGNAARQASKAAEGSAGPSPLVAPAGPTLASQPVAASSSAAQPPPTTPALGSPVATVTAPPGPPSPPAASSAPPPPGSGPPSPPSSGPTPPKVPGPPPPGAPKVQPRPAPQASAKSASGSSSAQESLRRLRKIYSACANFTSAELAQDLVQLVKGAGAYYASLLGKLANASDDPTTWAKDDADTWTLNSRFTAGNVMTSLFGPGGRVVGYTYVEPAPPSADNDFNAFAKYLLERFYPVVAAVLRTAVRAVGEAQARTWLNESTGAWGTQPKAGTKELAMLKSLIPEMPDSKVTGEFWTARAIYTFIKSPVGQPKYFNITKQELQQEAEPAVRANFSNIFYALFYRLSRHLNISVRQLLRDKIEGPWPDGLIVVFNFTHGPFNFGTIGQTQTALTFQPLGASMALEAGVNWSSQTCFFTPYALIAHEMAHSVFLKHWLAGDGPDFTSHDNLDYNCMMCYPHLELPRFTTIDANAIQDEGQRQILANTQAAYTVKYDWAPGREGKGGKIVRWSNHALPRNFKPHFCGKCNLMLRGWNIWAGGVLPKSSHAQGDYDITAVEDFKPA